MEALFAALLQLASVTYKPGSQTTHLPARPRPATQDRCSRTRQTRLNRQRPALHLRNLHRSDMCTLVRRPVRLAVLRLSKPVGSASKGCIHMVVCCRGKVCQVIIASTPGLSGLSASKSLLLVPAGHASQGPPSGSLQDLSKKKWRGELVRLRLALGTLRGWVTCSHGHARSTEVWQRDCGQAVYCGGLRACAAAPPDRHRYQCPLGSPPPPPAIIAAPSPQ